jgi:hypothetical protein
MSKKDVEVVSIKIARQPLTARNVPALRELFGLEQLPMAESMVEIEIKGIPVAAVNALRRVVLDEMPGRCLMVPATGGWDAKETTELFMLPQYCNKRIALIPLRTQIPVDVVTNLRLELDVSNNGTSVMSVYAGDMVATAGAMPEPLFNPTFKIAVLQPGKRLVIRNIYISSGYGRDNGCYNVARRAVFRHLDLEQWPEKETHEKNGSQVDMSGYKASCLVSNPRHHMLAASIPATTANQSEVRAVFADACANIKERLRLIASTIDRVDSAAAGPTHRGVQFTVVELADGLSVGTLRVPGESDTIGNILCRAVFDELPEIVYVASELVKHENQMVFTIRHTGDVARLLHRVVEQSILMFDKLQRGISNAPLR